MNNIKRIHFKSIPSTHLYAKDNCQNLQPGQIQLITADFQSAGIGTKNTSWISPPNVNIYATYSLLINNNELKNIFFIPQIACLQVSKLLESEGLQPKIKWVNDVMIGRKKICGILSQSVLTPNKNSSVLIVSVGLNVNSTKNQFLELDQPATSMLILTNKQYTIEDLITKLSDLLITGIDNLFHTGFVKFYDAINIRLEKFNNEIIKFKKIDASYDSGIIQQIDTNGALILDTCTGIRKYFNGSIIPPNYFY